MMRRLNEVDWGDPVCVRELFDSEGHVVTVRMWAPRVYEEYPPRGGSKHSIAAFQVVLPGREDADIHVYGGMDGFQSLILALQGIQLFLDAYALKPTWDGMMPMCHGFPEFGVF